jgi:hypothetical protein
MVGGGLAMRKRRISWVRKLVRNQSRPEYKKQIYSWFLIKWEKRWLNR